ncbi:MAG: hypothetical protein K0R38_3636 [Polyangiaceae bacterium]|jgi:hypothetical protein|nr:hypothetical protein [Polyangiaceae bacterium]
MQILKAQVSLNVSSIEQSVVSRSAIRGRCLRTGLGQRPHLERAL